MSRKFVPLFFVKDNVLVVNTDEFELIPEYKAVVKGYRKFDDKSKTFKTLSFIWLFACYDSPHINLPDQERFEEAVKDAKLEKSFYPSDEIWAAVHKFQNTEDIRFPELTVLLALKRGLFASKKTINMLTEEINSINDDIKKNRILIQNNEGTPEIINIYKITVDSDKVRLMDTQKHLQVLQKDIPASIIKIEEMTKKLKVEYSEGKVVRGGGEVYGRENPNN